MNDSISRQAAIDTVKAYLIDCQIEDADWHGNGIEYELKNLPSAQQWHTEPPKESGFYIVCTDLGEVGECVYTDDGEWDTDRNYRFSMWCQIVAWMPMPERYPYQVQKWRKK